MSNPDVKTLHQPAPDMRITQIDVLRGVAVLGIYWINIMVFALPYTVYMLPVLMGDATVANSWVWGFSAVFVDGTMRALFSMLFGASAMLFLDETRLAGGGLDVVDRYYRRTLLLMVFGLIHAWLLLWPYDVLYAYGLLGLFLFPLRKVAPPILLVIGALLLLLGDLGVSQTSPSNVPGIERSVLDQRLPAEAQKPDLSDKGLGETMAIQLEEEIAAYRSGYARIFEYQKKDVIDQQSTNMYDTHFFDIGGMMLLGMALFRLGILSGRRTKAFYLQMLLLAYLCGIAFRAPDVIEAVLHGFSLTLLLGHESATYNIGRVSMTLGHIGLICLLCQTSFFSRIARMLAAVGRMALTNYIMQTVISMFIFFGFGFGLYASFERYQLLFICLAIWAAQITFSLFWFRHYHYGPMEWVWRSLIYGQRQKFRKKATFSD